MYKIEHIFWETSPKTLRRMADEMEKKIDKLKIGNSRTVVTVTEDYFVLNIQVSQEYIDYIHTKENGK